MFIFKTLHLPNQEIAMFFHLSKSVEKNVQKGLEVELVNEVKVGGDLSV